MPDEPLALRVPEHIRTLAANVHSNPGPGQRAARLRHQALGARSWTTRSTSGARGRRGSTSRARRRSARAGRVVLDLQRRPAQRARARRSTRPPPRPAPWPGPPSSTTSTSTSTGTACTGSTTARSRASGSQNVWANPITFDNRGQPNKTDHGYINGDGVLFYPGRGEGPSRGGPRHRGAGGHRAAREPAPRAAGPPVPDAGPPARADGGGGRGAARGGAARVLGRGRRRWASRRRATRTRRRGGSWREAIVAAAKRARDEDVRRLRLRGVSSAPRPVAARRARASPPAHRRARSLHRPARAEGALRRGRAPLGRPARAGPSRYLLTGDEAFARRAVDEMRARPSCPRKGGSSLYIDYMSRALAFDWLYGFAGFDAALKDRVAGELVDGAAAHAGRCSRWPTRRRPRTTTTPCASWRWPSFALAAVEGHPSVEARAAPLREQARRALDNILETTDLVNPEGGYHESMDYMRITWAPLALDGRAAPHDDAATIPPGASASSATWARPTSTRSCPTARPRATTTTSSRTSTPWTTWCSGYAVHRFKDPYAAWILRESGWLPAKWRIPVLEFLWSDDTVVAARSRDHHRRRAAARAALPRGRPPRPARRLGAGLDLDRVLLRALLRQARPPRHEPLRRSTTRATSRSTPAPTTPTPRARTTSTTTGAPSPTTRCSSTSRARRSSGARTCGRPPTTAASAWTRRASGTRCAASRTGGARATSGTAGAMEAFDPVPGALHLRARRRHGRLPPEQGRALRARAASGCPGARVLFVLDRVRSTDPVLSQGLAAARRVGAEGRGRRRGRSRRRRAARSTARRASSRFEDGAGPAARALACCPLEREVVVRGGPGCEFWTPGDEHGGAWGSGQNWPLDPARGRARCPTDPYLARCGRRSGARTSRGSRPRIAARWCPAAGAIEVSPGGGRARRRLPDVLEIGDRGGAAAAHRAASRGHRASAGAVVAGEAAVLLGDRSRARCRRARPRCPTSPSAFLLVDGPRAAARRYDAAAHLRLRARGRRCGGSRPRPTTRACIQTPWDGKDGRLRIRRLGPAEGATR